MPHAGVTEVHLTCEKRVEMFQFLLWEQSVPELPEVETVRRGLEPVLAGRTLAKVTQRRADLRWPLPDRFGERLQGRAVLRLRRRSK